MTGWCLWWFQLGMSSHSIPNCFWKVIQNPMVPVTTNQSWGYFTQVAQLDSPAETGETGRPGRKRVYFGHKSSRTE